MCWFWEVALCSIWERKNTRNKISKRGNQNKQIQQSTALFVEIVWWISIVRVKCAWLPRSSNFKCSIKKQQTADREEAIFQEKRIYRARARFFFVFNRSKGGEREKSCNCDFNQSIDIATHTKECPDTHVWHRNEQINNYSFDSARDCIVSWKIN